MTLAELESVSVIAVSWVTIISIILSLVRRKSIPPSTPTITRTAAGTWKTKYTVRLYLKWIRIYVLSIWIFALILVNYATNDRPVTTLDVVSISACTGAIIFMLIGCAYKYILWQASRGFDNDVER